MLDLVGGALAGIAHHCLSGGVKCVKSQSAADEISHDDDTERAAQSINSRRRTQRQPLVTLRARLYPVTYATVPTLQ